MKSFITEFFELICHIETSFLKWKLEWDSERKMSTTASSHLDF